MSSNLTSIENVGIHPIVVLTISDFHNRMKITSNNKINRVYGALMGQKVGSKVEIFSAFEFVNNSTDNNKIDLDIQYIDTRKENASQLFPKLDIVGFFSTNSKDVPNENDKEILKTMNYFGVINPVYLVLSSEIEKANELPISAYLFEKDDKKFVKINHNIEGWESERICLETITKNADVEGDNNMLNKNLTTTKNALNVLKENLILIKNNIKKFENDKKFKELLDDLINNYPSIENSDYQEYVNEKEKEIFILNNLCAGLIEESYLSRTNNILMSDPLGSD
jgi:COP9 signalosome complex subunit 6